jgi:NAD(P)-dependent dehydrogenase (short-subunit alcohol dehydrogenase family)
MGIIPIFDYIWRMFNLQNKTAIVTGGGSGIGKAIAERFALQGATVFILELDAEAAQKSVDGIIGKGGLAHAYSCNVSNQENVNQVFASIVRDFNKIDILVNSAGIAHIGTVETTTVKGVYNTMRAAVSYMKTQRRGVILNLASIASSIGVADRFAYSMSKGAVLTMTYSVAKDFIKDNIRCNCISPARIHTSFVDGFLKSNYPGQEEVMFEKLSKTQPMGRMGRPDEVASLALYLCSDEAGFVTGTDYPIDGGFIRLNS